MTQTSTVKSQKVSKDFTEDKIFQRGQLYLTPFMEHHIEEVAANLSRENKEELFYLGHLDIRDALYDMMESAECYLVRKEGEGYMAVTGLWYYEDSDAPQMFAMFSNDMRQNYKAMIRGSKALMSFYDQMEPLLTMTVCAKYHMVLDWAAWLGFEPVGASEIGDTDYVEFVRCNPNQNGVYDNTSRPIIH